MARSEWSGDDWSVRTSAVGDGHNSVDVTEGSCTLVLPEERAARVAFALLLWAHSAGGDLVEAAECEFPDAALEAIGFGEVPRDLPEADGFAPFDPHERVSLDRFDLEHRRVIAKALAMGPDDPAEPWPDEDLPEWETLREVAAKFVENCHGNAERHTETLTRITRALGLLGVNADFTSIDAMEAEIARWRAKAKREHAAKEGIRKALACADSPTWSVLVDRVHYGFKRLGLLDEHLLQLRTALKAPAISDQRLVLAVERLAEHRDALMALRPDKPEADVLVEACQALDDYETHLRHAEELGDIRQMTDKFESLRTKHEELVLRLRSQGLCTSCGGKPSENMAHAGHHPDCPAADIPF